MVDYPSEGDSRPLPSHSPLPGGVALLPTLFTNVKTSLTSGLHLIFVCSAIIMVLSIPLHLLLRSEPLRTRVVEPELAAP